MTTACHLAASGHQVKVIERAAAPAQGRSFANAGIVAVGQAESWAGPNAPAQILRALADLTSNVKISKRTPPALWRWGLVFLRQCSARAHRETSKTMADLARHGRRALQALEQVTGLSFEQAHDGAYYLYGECAVFEARRVTLLYSDFPAMCREELTHLNAALKANGAALKGVVLPTIDSKGDCRRFTAALADWLAQNRNVTFRNGATATRVKTSTGPVSCNQLVIAAGVGTVALSRHFGARPLIYPVKTYSATYALREGARAPTRPLMDETHLIAATRFEFNLRVTAIAEFAGHDSSPNPMRSEHLDDHEARHFGTAVDQSAVSHWGGLRKHKKVWLNAGHGQRGWSMAAGAGQRLGGVSAPSCSVSETARWLRRA